MRDIPKSPVERFRIKTGQFASSRWDGNNGAFVIPHPDRAETYFLVICSDGKDVGDGEEEVLWEHVSVHVKYRVKRGRRAQLRSRTPEWLEMSYIKDLFFLPTETCVQFHVPPEDHVNCHEHCLHIWRHRTIEFVRPPAILIGPKPSTNPERDERESSE